MSKKRINPRRFKWHGLIHHPLYSVFYGLLRRCNNKKSPAYKDYGGRGIECRFTSFEEFYAWGIANGYSTGLTIDRRDNDGHYEPGNCRWITRAEQNKNRRDNKKVILNGELMIVSDACRKVGMRTSTFWQRVKRGLSLEQAITLAVR